MGYNNNLLGMISDIVRFMREFQEQNCIIKQCITNAQYLYDFIKTNGIINVKVKAVIVISNNYDKISIIVGGYLVVVLDDKHIIDPSNEIFTLKDKSYFDNIKDFTNNFNLETSNQENNRELIKQTIHTFLRFYKIAEQINNGELIITDKEFYNNQADYIEKKTEHW